MSNDQEQKQNETPAKFWADELAEKMVAERIKTGRINKDGQKFVICSGITPSGEIHVGNLREVLTAHTITLALQDLGKKPEFIFVADNMDPLRHVYPFLDAKVYEQHVGKPICRIPCPCGQHASYAAHFLAPFVQSLAELGMSPKVIGADTLYQRPEFAEIIFMALKHRDVIAKILHEQTGKQIEADWYPYNPICNKCGRINSTVVTGFDEKAKTVAYKCECGDQGDVSVLGGGKLTWRVDWPARWRLLEVTMEPFGKDHGTRGGSYDTGKLISQQVFNYEPPYPLMYEWISLKGLGDMSSSKGNVVSVHEMLKVLPADILRYFILRVHPIKSVTLDPGLPMLNLVDDYDSKEGRDKDRAIQLAQVSGFEALGVPFRHLVTIVQIVGEQKASSDLRAVKERLAHTGYVIKNDALLEKRIQLVLHWLKRFAPEEVKFALQQTVPDVVKQLSEPQRQVLHKLADLLQPNMPAETIHQQVYALKDEFQLKPAQLFEAVYMALLGKKSGPRVGMFLASLDMQWVKGRFREI